MTSGFIGKGRFGSGGFAGAGAAGGDPTVLLLHMDGTNGSTTFTDSSAYIHAMTDTTNGPALTTAQKKYGTASLDVTAGGCKVGIATAALSNPELSFTADFTLEAAIRRAATDTDNGIDGCIIGMARTTNAVLPGVELRVVNTSGVLRAVVVQEDGTAITTLTGSTNLNDGLWHQVALVRSLNVYSLYVDGTREATDTQVGTVPTVFGHISVGMAGVSSRPYYSGFIDEVRITNGLARYSGASYTPPSAAF